MSGNTIGFNSTLDMTCKMDHVFCTLYLSDEDIASQWALLYTAACMRRGGAAGRQRGRMTALELLAKQHQCKLASTPSHLSRHPPSDKWKPWWWLFSSHSGQWHCLSGPIWQKLAEKCKIQIVLTSFFVIELKGMGNPTCLLNESTISILKRSYYKTSTYTVYLYTV